VSEERGQRDSGTAGPGPGNAGSATDATPDDSSAAARPSGKRAARRSGDAGSGKAPARSAARSADRRDSGKSENIFKRLRRFIREVVAELRKVIWPNRKQLTTYTIVVIAFVAVTTAFIFGVDLAFAQGVNWLFG